MSKFSSSVCPDPAKIADPDIAPQTLGRVELPKFPLAASNENRFQASVELLFEPANLAVFVQDQRAALKSEILRVNTSDSAPKSGIDVAREYSDLIDAVVSRLFTLACGTTGANPQTIQLAIVATGGYGRRELAPFSDIDLTFIPHRDGDALTDRVVRELFRLVMDVLIAKCGLEIGYSYRLLSDCIALDHKTASGLLDARYIAGNQRLFITFENEFWDGFNAPEFIFTKIDERNLLLKKYGLFPRSVEPHLKEGPGGLRDIHTAVWLIQARAHLAATSVRGNRGINHLSHEAGFTESEIFELIRAKEVLFKVRNTLHALTGAERDQLVVTRQEDVAEALGYTNAHVNANGVPAVERFMADLYPALALCRQTCDRVMRSVGNSRLMLGIGLDCVDRQIEAANGTLAKTDPVWMVWACDMVQRYNLGLSDSMRSAAISLVKSKPNTSSPGEVAEVLMQMLSRVGSIYEITQTMADLGILSWILPEFGRLMDLIPYDASHDYTVGQHTLLVIHNIESVLTGSTKVTETEERAEMRRALEDLVHPEYLMLAALLHDTGKATPVSAHAEVSARIADNVCKRLGLSSEAAGQVRFLVLNHQLMGDTSRLRDLTMEKTIREFVSVVDDVERLNMLYLLTYADTRAVGEGIWTPVKGSFLRELWQRATAAIYDNEIQHCDEDSIAVARRNIKRSLSLEKLEGAEIEEHIEAMPPYYLLNSTLKEVALHISFVKRVRAGEVVIDFQDSRAFTELTICTNDDPTPGLLSKIAAALLAATLNVHSAKVVTRRTTFDSIALDTLIVDFKGRPLSAGKCKEVSYLLKSVLGGAKTISEILPANRSVTNLPVENEKLNPAHPNPPQPLSVDLINHDFDQGISLLEISGPTALVLFYKICAGVSALGWDIQAAKLSAARDLMRASLYLTGIKQMSDGDIRRRMMRSLEGTMVYREC